MGFRGKLPGAMFAAALAMIVSPALGQTLYSQNFDVDDTANWTVNNGPSDEAHDFFFDYSTVGIPSAPNSTGGSTRGMKLQANLFNAVFSGMSVSPTGKTFTGDYSVKFDWWHNFLGPLATGATGSTMLSQFGIQTSGTSANWPGASTLDGTYFGMDGDGGSGSDYRIYSVERNVSYQLPPNLTVLDGMGQPIDNHATYLAASRNNTAALYVTAFPGGVSAPAFQQTTYPATQTGTTAAGAAGFVWNAMEVRKVGAIVSLFANGIELMKVDETNYVTPNGGTNILFGHTDINATTNFDPSFPTLQFTLIDNVRVSTFVAPTDADFNNDNLVDGADFLILQTNFGGAGTNATGDANGDNVVNATDVGLFQAHYGLPSISAVPEPSAGLLAAFAALACVVASLPRRRPAMARIR